MKFVMEKIRQLPRIVALGVSAARDIHWPGLLSRGHDRRTPYR